MGENIPIARRVRIITGTHFGGFAKSWACTRKFIVEKRVMPLKRPPIRIVTRLLAELQTAIISRGLPLVDGDLDRFAILALILRQTAQPIIPPHERLAYVPIYPLALSLSRPYETVRRQVLQLVDARICERSEYGVRVVSQDNRSAALDAVIAFTHDCFVRFVDDLASLGIPMPRARTGLQYTTFEGVSAAVDLMLSVLDTNRSNHGDWPKLAIYSAILAANVSGYARVRTIATNLVDETRPTPEHIIRPAKNAQIARTLGLPETSVRRHIKLMIKDERVLRNRHGFLVNESWLNIPSNVEISRKSYVNVRRILERLAAEGFPFDNRHDAYIIGRPSDAFSCSYLNLDSTCF